MSRSAEGSDLVRTTMLWADGWFMCRIGYVETVRAVGLAGGAGAAATAAPVTRPRDAVQRCRVGR